MACPYDHITPQKCLNCTLPASACDGCTRAQNPSAEENEFVLAAGGKLNHKYPAKRKPPRKRITRICPVCGEQFQTSNSRQKYCSHQCNGKAYRMRKKAAIKGTTSTAAHEKTI